MLASTKQNTRFQDRICFENKNPTPTYKTPSQYLMEGSYNKVFLARFNVPAESYLFFIDILLDTIREQIASCMSSSYTTVTVAEATKLLFYDNQSKTKQFAEKHGWQGDGKVFR